MQVVPSILCVVKRQLRGMSCFDRWHNVRERPTGHPFPLSVEESVGADLAVANGAPLVRVAVVGPRSANQVARLTSKAMRKRKNSATPPNHRKMQKRSGGTQMDTPESTAASAAEALASMATTTQATSKRKKTLTSTEKTKAKKEKALQKIAERLDPSKACF